VPSIAENNVLSFLCHSMIFYSNYSALLYLELM
jgi:hypothetical protein